MDIKDKLVEIKDIEKKIKKMEEQFVRLGEYSYYCEDAAYESHCLEHDILHLKEDLAYLKLVVDIEKTNNKLNSLKSLKENADKHNSNEENVWKLFLTKKSVSYNYITYEEFDEDFED